MTYSQIAYINVYLNLIYHLLLFDMKQKKTSENTGDHHRAIRKRNKINAITIDFDFKKRTLIRRMY